MSDTGREGGTLSRGAAAGQDAATVSIGGGFWRRYQDLAFSRVIPYQWRALNDEIEGAPASHSIENFRIAAGLSSGKYDGRVFQDSDLAKWIEAVGHTLRCAANDDDFPEAVRRQISKRLDEVIRIVAAAQQPDGYLDTYFTVAEPDRRWTNLRDDHELYCAGHMIEAAVAVYRGAGDRRLLDVVIRLADHIASVFGTQAGKKRGYPGHQEIELALVKLAHVTGESKYLDLASYFIDERGARPNYFDVEAGEDEDRETWHNIHPTHAYRQAHVPVREQSDAVGHSVRAMYQYTAMADLAWSTGDAGLADACRRLWDSTVNRRMYVTGGIGSTHHGEAFTTDYDLPNDTAYAETCASIGLFFFANRMAWLDGAAHYADVAERALYNGVLSGLGQDGEHYFYVNPLEVVPGVCDTSGTVKHVKYRRQSWYGCACCPPNVARLLASLGDYFVRADEGALFVDHYFQGRIRADVGTGRLEVDLATAYPWEGEVVVTVRSAPACETALALRLPGWCGRPTVALKGNALSMEPRNGYAVIRRTWEAGDAVTLSLPMEVTTLRAHPAVRANTGLVAVQRGPIVYCLEEQDNGKDLHLVSLPAQPKWVVRHDGSLLGGVTVLATPGIRSVSDGRELYIDQTAGGTRGAASAGKAEGFAAAARKPCSLTFIPYFAWANRDAGEMRVWVAHE